LIIKIERKIIIIHPYELKKEEKNDVTK